MDTLTPRKSAGRSKSEEKRQQILDAAGYLFCRDGYEAVSMEQVAKTADVSKQTVYSHFGNKEELFCTAIECKCAEHQLREQPDGDRPVAEYLRAFIQHLSDLLTSPEVVAMHRVCIASADRHSEVCQLFWKSGPEPIKVHLRNYLTSQHLAGRLHIDNVDFATQQLLSMVRSTSHMKDLLGLPPGDEQAQLPAYLDSCVAVFMRAYGVRDATPTGS
jgi:TetR/AcrR family transcriptional regulator, mexJK operon transcriptional repressor